MLYMKCVSTLTSGVKKGESNATFLLRGEPLSQLKSPYANGVCSSTAGAAAVTVCADAGCGTGKATTAPAAATTPFNLPPPTCLTPSPLTLLSTLFSHRLPQLCPHPYPP